MKLKGSIAVFAVAAAFAGNVAAQYATDLSTCQFLLGYKTFKENTQSWGLSSGAFLEVMNQSAGFKSNKTMPGGSCPIPKNSTKRGNVSIEATVDAPFDITTDQCSAFSTLAAADQKITVGKKGDAISSLTTFQSKLSANAKVDSQAAALINAKVSEAVTCIQYMP